MSKGPGHIERAITVAFESNRDGCFTVADLAAMIYPAPPNRAQRVAIIRAATKVAPRMHWQKIRSWGRGGAVIYVNGLSLRSYVLGKLCSMNLRETDPYAAKKLAPGGDWWLTVERNRARASGDTTREQELIARLKQCRAEALEAYQSMECEQGESGSPG